MWSYIFGMLWGNELNLSLNSRPNTLTPCTISIKLQLSITCFAGIMPPSSIKWLLPLACCSGIMPPSGITSKWLFSISCFTRFLLSSCIKLLLPNTCLHELWVKHELERSWWWTEGLKQLWNNNAPVKDRSFYLKKHFHVAWLIRIRPDSVGPWRFLLFYMSEVFIRIYKRDNTLYYYFMSVLWLIFIQVCDWNTNMHFQFLSF